MAKIRRLSKAPIYFWHVYDGDGVFLGVFPLEIKPQVNVGYADGIIGQVYQEDMYTFRVYLQEQRKS